MLCEGAMGYECSLLRQSAAIHRPFASRERAGRCGYASWCPEGSCEAEPSTASVGAAASERPSREGSAAGPQSEAAPAAAEQAAAELSEQAAGEDLQRSGEAGDAEEPLLASNDDRFTMYPVRCAGLLHASCLYVLARFGCCCQQRRTAWILPPSQYQGTAQRATRGFLHMWLVWLLACSLRVGLLNCES